MPLCQCDYQVSRVGKWHPGWEWAERQSIRMTEVRNGWKTLLWNSTKPFFGGPRQRALNYYFGVDLADLPPLISIENTCVPTQQTQRYRIDASEGAVMPRGFVGAPLVTSCSLRHDPNAGCSDEIWIR